MSTYTPSAVTLGTSITIPADGESVEAADVNVPICALADAVKYNKNSIATLTSGLATETAARIAAVSVSHMALATSFSSSTPTPTSYTDVTGYSLAVTSCLAGDVLAIDASWLITALGASYMRVMINDGGTVDPAQSIYLSSGTFMGSADLLYAVNGVRSFKYVVANAGTVTIKVQTKGDGAISTTNVILGTASTGGAGSTLRVMRFR